MPPNDGLGLDEQHGVQQVPESPSQGRNEPSVEPTPPGVFDLPTDDDELLAKEQVFGDQGCPASLGNNVSAPWAEYPVRDTCTAAKIVFRCREAQAAGRCLWGQAAYTAVVPALLDALRP